MKFEVKVSVTEGGKIQPEYNINSDTRGELSLASLLEFTKAALILVSDNTLKEEQSNGFDKTPIMVVDGSVGKNPAQVHPLGSIEFVSRANMKDIIRDTFDGIISRSPILTGRYISSNAVLLNGKLVATGQNSLDAWLATDPVFEEKDFVTFVNVQPYARKLERQGVTGDRTKTRSSSRKGRYKTSPRRKLLNQPNGTYYLTARAIRAKYRRNSVIKFTFLAGSALGLTSTFKAGRKGKPGRTYLYPTITISVQESGTL